MSEVERLVDAMKRIQIGDAWHGPGLQEILANITPEQALAKPIATNHNIWELVLHIAAWEEAFCKRLEGVRIDVPSEGDFPELQQADAGAWAKTVQRMDQAHQQLIDVVSRMTASTLDQQVIGKDYTVGFMLHGIIRHNVYHAGQIRLLHKSM